MKPRHEAAEPSTMPVPSNRRRKKKHNSDPAFDVQAHSIGVDMLAVLGIGPNLAQTMLSEIGTDLSKWPSEKHFASWLGVAPHNDISGGRVLRSRTLPTRNRAGQAFRQAATSASHSSTAWGAFYRRKRAKGGPLYAQVATANKIARVVYPMLKFHVQYDDIGVDEFERHHRQRDIAILRKKAAHLGFALVGSEDVQAAA